MHTCMHKPTHTGTHIAIPTHVQLRAQHAHAHTHNTHNTHAQNRGPEEMQSSGRGASRGTKLSKRRSADRGNQQAITQDKAWPWRHNTGQVWTLTTRLDPVNSQYDIVVGILSNDLHWGDPWYLHVWSWYGSQASIIGLARRKRRYIYGVTTVFLSGTSLDIRS